MKKDAYNHVASNNAITWILILMFPLIFMLLFYAVSFVLLFLVYGETVTSFDEYQVMINEFIFKYLPFVIGAGFLWMMYAYYKGDGIMLGFAGAMPANKDDPKMRKIKLYVETAALAVGLPAPKLYIIDDTSLNAFATGHSPRTASIALTTGIIDKLEPIELQAVIAHEMAHIKNRDVRLDMVIIAGLGIFGLISEFGFRMLRVVFRSGGGRSKSKGKGGGQIVIFALAFAITFWLFNLFVAPFIHMAISRAREYAADATAAVITRNPHALADALLKISKDARVEVLEDSPLMAVACIYPPLKSLSKRTHPPIHDRVKRLQGMAGIANTEYNIS